jgi:hypothetical protein
MSLEEQSSRQLFIISFKANAVHITGLVFGVKSTSYKHKLMNYKSMLHVFHKNLFSKMVNVVKQNLSETVHLHYMIFI